MITAQESFPLRIKSIRGWNPPTSATPELDLIREFIENPAANPMTNLSRNGFKILRGVFTAHEIQSLRLEANRVATSAGSACVRHLRDHSGLFRELALTWKIRGILADENLHPVRSILFDKTPDENWPVAWHQDLTICTQSQAECEGYGPWSVKNGVPHVQPPTRLLEEMVTVRIHLDPTDSGNGALRVIPGSHLHGRLSALSIAEFTASGVHTCDCGPGDVLLMSPLILHSSQRSASPSRRRIIHFEFAPTAALDARLAWHEPY